MLTGALHISAFGLSQTPPDSVRRGSVGKPTPRYGSLQTSPRVLQIVSALGRR